MPFLQNEHPSTPVKPVSDYPCILFDLDGTLLPMDQDRFTRTYIQLLVQKAVPCGYEPETLTRGLLAGIEAMVQNDGSALNQQMFWDTFTAVTGQDSRMLYEMMDSFYRDEFSLLKSVTIENPDAAALLAALKRRGHTVVLATNPLFPLGAVQTRLSWVGLTSDDFSHVTTYENSRFCKPNPHYYEEILTHIHAKPDDCLMIGNDAREDIEGATLAGIASFLVTDWLIDRGMDLSAFRKGTFTQLKKSFFAENG